MSVDFLITVRLRDFRKELTADFEVMKDEVSKFNKTEAIFLAARLNLFTSTARKAGADAFEKAQFDCLSLLFQDGYINSSILKNLVLHAKEVAFEKDQRSAFFTRPGLIELIRSLCLWGVERGDPTSFLMSDHSQEAFMTSIFIANDLYHRRNETIRANEGDTLEGRRRAFQPWIRIMSDYAAPLRESLNYLGRAKTLLFEEFLNKEPLYLGAFERAHMGLRSIEYLVCAAAIFSQGLSAMPQAKPQKTLRKAFEFNKNQMFPESGNMNIPFHKFLACKGQTISQLAAKFRKEEDSDGCNSALDIKCIRERPILLREDIGIVIDEKLFAESVSVGPLFALLGTDEKENQKLFSDFGMACQRYAHRIIEFNYDVLQESAPKTEIIYEPEAQFVTKPSQKRSLGDSAVMKNRVAVLFETKGGWFGDRALKSEKAYWNAINRLYGISTEKGKQVRHGFAQLADTIKLLASEEIRAIEQANCLNEAESVIPVLLAHDELVSNLNLAHLLALDFMREFDYTTLPEVGSFKHGKLQVHTLIVLSFNELEMIQAKKLEDGLEKCFEEFSAWSPTRENSLEDFLLERYSNSGKRTQTEQFLLKNATEVLDEVAIACFGKGLGR